MAWNLWLYSVLLIYEFGLITANNLAYAAGSRGGGIAESKGVILTASVALGVSPDADPDGGGMSN